MPEVTMPRLSDTMQEGKVARWLKQPGEPVSPGDVLAEIETDKATMELEAYDAGVLQRILVPEGESAPIGQPIAVIGAGAAADGAPAAARSAPPQPPNAEGSAPPQPPNSGGSPSATSPAASGQPAATVQPGAQPAPAAPAAAPGTASVPPARPFAAPGTEGVAAAAPSSADQGEVRASPMARAIARERGIDLRTVHGSGPGGRVIRADVEALGGNGHAPAPPTSAPPEGVGVAPAAATTAPAQPAATPLAAPPAPAAAAQPAVAAPAPAGQPTAAPPGDDVEVRPVGRGHQVMAERTLQSVRDIPQYYLTAEIDMQAALDLRRQLEATFGEEVRITINAIVLRATALALREVPEVNSVWRDGQWLLHRRVHLGMAVAIPDGLIVPVIRDADRKSLSEIAVESRALASRAREGKLSLPEMQGSTFSVTNLGMFDVEEFHGIINPPEAGLLAVGTVVEKPVGLDGQIVLRPRMRVTLTADHRAYSGDVGARFLQVVKRLLEEPLRLGF
jgi:pyruvate dehydrogenase E2 component (dihydrolipoamide acetyltransferase)